MTINYTAMKNSVLIFIVFILSAGGAWAQNGHLVVFSEFGEEFKLYLNNRLQNETPQTNVKVIDLNQEFYKARIEFVEKGKGIINKNIVVKPGMEIVYMIKQGRKGYVVRYRNETALEQASENNDIYVHSYEEVAQPQTEQIQQGESMAMEVETEVPAEGITETEETTMNVEFGGMNISVNSSVKTTERSSSTSMRSSTSTNSNATRASQPSHYQMPGYSGTVGCAWPMENDEFTSVKENISSKTFEDTKLSTAKQIAKAKCFTADQVKQTMDLFTYEESRLEFAQFAWDKTFDVDNYYKVNDAFQFELTIEELQEFIDSK